jgi:predicted Zn-dependent protease with MMP-like domain
MKQMDSACRLTGERKMEREKFVKLVEEALGALPAKFRKRIHNVAVLVEDVPPKQLSRRGSRNAGIIDSDNAENLVLGVFEGVPTTKKSVFDLSAGPDRIVLYQKNIEAVCSNEYEIRKEIRQTVLHELGHYFGMTEAQLEDISTTHRVNHCVGSVWFRRRESLDCITVSAPSTRRTRHRVPHAARDRSQGLKVQKTFC